MIHAMLATIGVFLGLAAVVAIGAAFLKVIFGVK